VSVGAARHEFLEIRGVRHRITRWGPPSDDPIVLLHGFLDNAATFQFLVDALPPEWSFAAPDWRGFGDTASTRQPYWFPDYFGDLEALLDALVPQQRARVIGHSMGGNIGLLYAGIRPQRLRWIVSLEGFGLPRSQPEQAPARYAQWLDQLREPRKPSVYPDLERLEKTLRARNPRLTAERAAFVARAWTRPVAGGHELAADPMHRLVNPTLYRRDETEACWRQVEIPVLMLLAACSEYLPGLGEDGSEARFRSMLRHLTLHTLPEVGHMMHHEDPAAVAALIRDFVAAQDSGVDTSRAGTR
jgi:pimeloyl-ACP methyl ester carboxylesterase